MAKEIITKRTINEDGILLERQNFVITNEKLYVLADPAWFLLTVIDGVFSSSYGEGKHLLVNQKFEFLKRRKPVYADVIFISKDYKVKTIWGTPAPFDFKDLKTDVVIKVGANGEGEISIADPVPFFRKLVASKTKYTSEDLEEFVRSRFVLEINDIISKILVDEKISFYEFVTKHKEISEKVFERVKNMFLEDYGLIISSFTLNRIYVNDEDKEKIKAAEEKVVTKRELEEQEEKDRKIKEELKRDAKEIAAELERLDDKEWERNLILRKLEQSDYEKYLDVVKLINIAESNAKAVQGELSVKEVEEVKTQVLCSVCGEILPENGRFCPKCGKPIDGIKIKCKHCNGEIVSGSAFCPHCGKSLN